MADKLDEQPASATWSERPTLTLTVRATRGNTGLHSGRLPLTRTEAFSLRRLTPDRHVGEQAVGRSVERSIVWIADGPLGQVPEPCPGLGVLNLRVRLLLMPPPEVAAGRARQLGRSEQPQWRVDALGERAAAGAAHLGGDPAGAAGVDVHAQVPPPLALLPGQHHQGDLGLGVRAGIAGLVRLLEV